MIRFPRKVFDRDCKLLGHLCTRYIVGLMDRVGLRIYKERFSIVDIDSAFLFSETKEGDFFWYEIHNFNSVKLPLNQPRRHRVFTNCFLKLVYSLYPTKTLLIRVPKPLIYN